MIPILACVVLLSAPPQAGLCVSEDGRWFVGGATGVTQLSLKDNGLQPVGYLPGKYSDDLDLYSVGSSVYVVDYSNDFVEYKNATGRTQWKAKLRSAYMTDVDDKGVIWSIAEGGTVCRKTADSSAFEPLLDQFGGELAMPDALDIAPTADGLYVLDEEGVITRGKKIATVEHAQRILPAKNGVLAFVADGADQSIVYVDKSGAARKLWTAPQELGRISHFSRVGPGKALVAGPKDTGGFAMIVELREKV